MTNKNQETRPEIDTIICGNDLRRWYWLKEELVVHARHLGVKTTGGKFVILDRLAHYLDTGETKFPGDNTPKPVSKFDWTSAALNPETSITDNYKNTENVRRYFTDQIGRHFKFNIAFMEWMKTNVGRTLADAVAEYNRQLQQQDGLGTNTEIKSHNQFNQYMRDFLADNPNLGIGDVRRYWALKRSLPSSDGRHVYEKTDLGLE